MLVSKLDNNKNNKVKIIFIVVFSIYYKQ